ncbi:N-6 DNA methylase [Mesomycoplasma dispar]|uniref:N-6 DNA methylase n=1 Tax=Mesomycoplasma dispar TaxID=86660 RepID=UPI001E54CCD6|nr:N-6 DNA methylase [Mesomycoplasma dispar]
MKPKTAEASVANHFNSELKAMEIGVSLESEPLNDQIDFALNEYYSKSGNKGGNKPDAKLLKSDSFGNYYPILIEYKSGFNKMVKLDDDSFPDLSRFDHIKNFAVNGAIHYAKAVILYTYYPDVIAIGAVGEKNKKGEFEGKIEVWWVSKENYTKGQKVGEYSDFSFLAPKHFDKFIEKTKNSFLSQEEKDKIRQKTEAEMEIALKKLNNDIYKNELNIEADTKLHLIVASIIASLIIPNKVKPLTKNDLKSENEINYRDGEKILRKIISFLREKGLLPEKQKSLINILKPSLEDDALNFPENGESRIRKIFVKVIDNIGYFFKNGLEIDFAGKLFNEMYSWLGFSEDKKNDVVLTPPYVAKLLVKLARVNQDSYVWDFASGSGGLLVAAMNEMIADATQKAKSPKELETKKTKIKKQQLLGIEILPKVHMLAILNMIIMGDGSSSLLKGDSLEFVNEKNFPANAFILNPPYSTAGNGMVFVKKALSMMKNGYAAIIIQSSAGSGKAREYNVEILKKNTLLASIKMPIDLFIGKSSVQTHIYVFQVGQSHHKDYQVKFIDFSDDGYKRTNRKKASINLVDSNNATARYQELVNLVNIGEHKLDLIGKNNYFTDVIDPLNGGDWNKTKQVDLKPSIADFKKSIGDFLIWEIAEIIKKTEIGLEKAEVSLVEKIQWGEFKIGDLFTVSSSKKIIHANKVQIYDKQIPNSYPYVVRQSKNNGIKGYIKEDPKFLNPKNTISFAQDTFFSFFQKQEYFTGNNIKILKYKNSEEISQKSLLFIATTIQKAIDKFDWGINSSKESVLNTKFLLPVINGKIDFDFIELFTKQLEVAHLWKLKTDLLAELKTYSVASALDSSKLQTDKEKLK